MDQDFEREPWVTQDYKLLAAPERVAAAERHIGRITPIAKVSCTRQGRLIRLEVEPNPLLMNRSAFDCLGFNDLMELEALLKVCENGSYAVLTHGKPKTPGFDVLEITASGMRLVDSHPWKKDA